MPASTELHQELDRHFVFRRLDKQELVAFEGSLSDVTATETLRVCGRAHTVDGGGLKTDGYTYYFITDRGLYFGGKAKTGVFKKEARHAFVPRSAVASGEVTGPPSHVGVEMGFLKCKAADGADVLFMSFDDIAGNDAPPLDLAHRAAAALGLAFE